VHVPVVRHLKTFRHVHRHRSRQFISAAAHEDVLAVGRWLGRLRLTEDGELVQVTQSIENIELAYRAARTPSSSK
jgi:uncharacterized NAD(P)/FAD-binding protein YdhS